MSTVHDARLLPVALGAWTAALIATGGAATVAIAGALLIAGAGLMVLTVPHVTRDHARKTTLRAIAAVCILTGVAGATVAVVAGLRHSTYITQGEALIAAHTTDAWVSIDGQAAPLKTLDGSQRWRVAATVTAWRPHCAHQSACEPWQGARTPVTVSLDARPSRGAVVLLTGAWDQSDRPPQAAVAWQAEYIDTGPASALLDWRERFAAATENVPPHVRGLVRGMTVGDTSTMSQEQNRQMRVSGLAHLTAVSGAHFAILVMTCVSVLGALRAPRVVRALAVLATAGTFAAVVGPDSSVLRALAMACAVALALAWGRPARGFAALLTGVSVLLIFDPWLARTLGFAMSVLAVAAIVLWAPRIAALAATVVTPAFARVVSIPIAAQAAVTPLLVVMEPGIGPYAVFANLVAGLAVLPTMLACAATLALAAISVPLASLLAPVAGFFASGIAYVARTATQAPGSWIPWPDGVLGIVGAALVTLLMVVVTVPLGLQHRVVAVILAISLIGAGTSFAHPARDPVPANWEVAACDIGQGDMLLLRAGSQSAVVIDTGPPDSGAAECLLRHRIGHVPLLVLTHPHLDHDGAVSDVIQVAQVDQAWVSAHGQADTAAMLVAATGAAVRVPQTGEQITVGDVHVEVVSEWHTEEQRGENDASVIVRAQVGHTSVIALGDLEVPGQRALTSVLEGTGPVDVVKMAHHGSRQQSATLAKQLSAQVALVSVGEDNRHNHPTASALDMYSEYAGAVLRTDTCGDLHVSSSSGELRWSQCP